MTLKNLDHFNSKNWSSLDVDYDALTRKYEQERAKRITDKGVDQYHHVVDNASLLSLAKDPFVKPGFKRDPITKHADVAIIGGGVGGLLVACRLIKAGHTNIMVIEKGGDVGGVWYWNRYPGIQIDIESYIYMPLLEDLGYVPSMKYCAGAEIHSYLKALAEHYGVYDKTFLQTEAREMRWDENSNSWQILTDRNDNLTANWLVPSTGPFDEPKFPGIPGIDSFQGHQFHSSRWDYEYTGGDSSGGLYKLQDKRVGVIGTGATGIQVIPHLGAAAKQLFVFQRTPSSVDFRGNTPTDESWFKGQKPGWQRTRMDNFARLVSGIPQDEDMVNDGWTNTVSSLNGWFGQDKAANSANPEAAENVLQLADYKKMSSIRQRVDNIVKDKATAEALKPYYNLYCKRPCFHDDYLPTFNRPNVTLVDTKGKGVERVTQKGIVVDGKEYELDVIVYATGFEYATDWHVRHHANIYGRDGVTISERWSDGLVTFHGWAVQGFPNTFFVSSAQTSGTANYHHSLDDQATHLTYILSKFKNDGIVRMEATDTAEKGWIVEVIRAGKARLNYLNTCTPGYYNDEGHVSDITSKNNPYGGGVEKFLEIVATWRQKDDLEGIDVRFAN